MVCFCDIRLSNITSHLDVYGQYGIGLKKEWGIKNKINPVLYLNKNAKLIEHILNFHKNKAPDLNLIEFESYLKPYQGSMKRKGKTYKRCFYDEKEWRHIPAMTTPGHQFILSQDEYSDKEKRNKANKELENHCLSFSLKDIRYIIVKNEKDILDIVHIYKKQYDENEVMALIPRIISTKHINEDF